MNKYLRSIIVLGALLLTGFTANAGRVVKHQHKCPGIFRGLDICANYLIQDEIVIGTTVSFIVEFYSWESSQNGGPREYVEMDDVGTMTSELMMAHGHGDHMSMPLKLTKLAPGRYLISNAAIVMAGMYGFSFYLQMPGAPLLKQANLFTYVYPDSK